MTTITLPRATVERALEAFDIFGEADDFESLQALTVRMSTLRAALEQQGQEPSCPECGAYGLLYECIACSASSYPEQRPEQRQEPVNADNLKAPENGKKWRVEWWNESCRLMLPANKRLDSFTSHKNGTLQFTIKEQS